MTELTRRALLLGLAYAQARVLLALLEPLWQGGARLLSLH